MHVIATVNSFPHDTKHCMSTHLESKPKDAKLKALPKKHIERSINMYVQVGKAHISNL